MDMKQLTKIALVWELHEAGVPQTHIAQRLGINRDTVRVWINGVKAQGLTCFLETYEKSKKGPRFHRQIDPILKRWIWEIRDAHHDCCGQKIVYYLIRDHGISVSVPKIYEILKEKLIIKSKWKKNQVRGPVPHAMKPREVVQMDTIDFGDLFAFTGIDIYTREADILIAPALTANFGYQFLKQSMGRRFGGHVALLQTDGGPEFKEDFKQHVTQFCDRHRVARPYKKNEQAYIESFNRTVRKECLGWTKYRTSQLQDCTNLVETFLDDYHYDRPHMGKGMKPPLARS